MRVFTLSNFSTLCGLLLHTASGSQKEPDLRNVFQEPDDPLCTSHLVLPGDRCANLAEQYHVTVADIESYNKGTFGWNGWDKIFVGTFICLSAGSPPMPVALPQAICGPQVPGTARPSNMSDLVDLNPCIAPDCKCSVNGGFCTDTVNYNHACPTGAATSSTTGSTSKATTITTTTAGLSAVGPPIKETRKYNYDQYQHNKDNHDHSHDYRENDDYENNSKDHHNNNQARRAHREPKRQQMESKHLLQKELQRRLLPARRLQPWENNTMHQPPRYKMSTDEKADAWCRWVSTSDAMFIPCSSSPLRTPGSWNFKNAVCSVYKTDDCSGSAVQSYTSYGSVQCQDYTESSSMSAMEWNSMKCQTLKEAYDSGSS
ncbi:hypothetical protein N7532_009175 [Penicillium argentinense]|uniref:LysM domain-containing protein n=1 Tax=Penicillium argentinense TaxID=1131581 RepID=A0A9W9EZ09_9EURO|nr:uncharacterized protein N7532_009175 [Penicillium argentinense]KAJ5090491.1 hypothetical protein N7532_009175 [Penicillium argentinense]